MAFEVACRCGARFAAEDHLSGRIVPCPSCGQPLSMLSPAAVASHQPPPVLTPILGPAQQQAASPHQPAPPSQVAPASDSSQRFLFIVGGIGGGAVVLLLAVIIASSWMSSKENASSDATLPATTGQSNSPSSVAGGSSPAASSSATSSSPATSNLPLDSVASTLKNAINDRIGSPGYATPEAAYGALRSAVRSKDWGKVYDCLTDDYRDRLVASKTIFFLLSSKDEPEMAAVLARHGITETKVQLAQLAKAGTKTIGITPKQFEATKNLASDPRAFFVDAFEVEYREMLDLRQKSPDKADIQERGLMDVELLVEFRDLRIRGAQAMGRFEGPDGVLFEQTARGWLVSGVSTDWGVSMRRVRKLRDSGGEGGSFNEQ